MNAVHTQKMYNNAGGNQMSDNPLKNIVMYCVKCRHKVNINNPKMITLKSQRKALQGSCPHCNTTTYKFVPNS